MAVTVRVWAAARDAAGTAEGEYADPDSLAALLAEVREAGPAALSRVLEISSYLVNGDPVGKRDHAAVRIPAGAVVEVLPPYAGG